MTLILSILKLTSFAIFLKMLFIKIKIWFERNIMVSKHFTKLLYFCRFCCNGKYLEIEVKEKKLYFCQFKKRLKKYQFLSMMITDWIQKKFLYWYHILQISEIKRWKIYLISYINSLKKLHNNLMVNNCGQLDFKILH